MTIAPVRTILLLSTLAACGDAGSKSAVQQNTDAHGDDHTELPQEPTGDASATQGTPDLGDDTEWSGGAPEYADPPIACESTAQCPPPTLYSDSPLCEPAACEGPPVCRYPKPPSAAPPSPQTVCTCEGAISVWHMNASSLAFPAYVISSGHFCPCTGDEICERSVCEGAPCDPSVDFRGANSITPVLEGRNLPYLDGTPLVVRRAAQGFVFGGPIEKTVVAIEGGIVEALLHSPGEVSILLDLDANGSCSEGEVTLPYSRHLELDASRLRYVIETDVDPIPCRAP